MGRFGYSIPVDPNDPNDNRLLLSGNDGSVTTFTNSGTQDINAYQGIELSEDHYIPAGVSTREFDMSKSTIGVSNSSPKEAVYVSAADYMRK